MADTLNLLASFVEKGSITPFKSACWRIHRRCVQKPIDLRATFHAKFTQRPSWTITFKSLPLRLDDIA